MEPTFNPIEYLSGLTGFAFEEETLKRVAYESGLVDALTYTDVTEEMRDKALMGLLQTVLDGPWSTPTQKSKHGDFEVSIGSQTVTAAIIEQIKRRLKKLHEKYGIEDDIEVGEMRWVDENQFGL